MQTASTEDDDDDDDEGSDDDTDSSSDDDGQEMNTEEEYEDGRSVWHSARQTASAGGFSYDGQITLTRATAPAAASAALLEEHRRSAIVDAMTTPLGPGPDTAPQFAAPQYVPLVKPLTTATAAMPPLSRLVSSEPGGPRRGDGLAAASTLWTQSHSRDASIQQARGRLRTADSTADISPGMLAAARASEAAASAVASLSALVPLSEQYEQSLGGHLPVPTPPSLMDTQGQYPDRYIWTTAAQTEPERRDVASQVTSLAEAATSPISSPRSPHARAIVPPESSETSRDPSPGARDDFQTDDMPPHGGNADSMDPAYRNSGDVTDGSHAPPKSSAGGQTPGSQSFGG